MLAVVCACAVLWPGPAAAQFRRGPRVVVFRGGFYDPFFYDPFFAPWYPYGAWYPYPYLYPGPLYPDQYGYRVRYGEASLRLEVKPKDAQVYIDGYYAGVVDDFDHSNGGVDVDWADQPAAAPGNPRIVLDANVGVGRIAVGHFPEDQFRTGHPENYKFGGQLNTGCGVVHAR